MLRFFVAFTVLAVGFVPLQAADPESQEFVSKEGKYKVTFPGKVETKEVKGKDGKFTTHSATAIPRPGAVFNVNYFDFDADLPANMSKELLAALTKGIKGKTLSDKELSFGTNKLPVREGIYELPGAHIRQLMILDGRRVYQVIVGGPKKEDVTSKEADKFLASFQLTK